MPSPRRPVRLQLPVALWDAIGAAAKAAKITPGELIQRALRADLARAAADPPKGPARRRSR
jgi:hypothetical protein